MTPAEQWSRSHQLLRERRYAEAWPLYEARRALPIDVWIPITDAPEWRGEPLAGRRIVVCAEQGYGDQMMFGRYLGALAAQGAEVVIACDPRALARLFETLGYWTRPCWTDRPIPPCDFWAPFGSLPLRLGSPAPPPPKYLDIPGGAAGGVGVLARGAPGHAHDRHRSLPPAFEERLRALGRDLAPAATGAHDFLATAEIVAGLDLVITVDTALAHLAGAMGKPCWVLLPFDGLDWRWNDAVKSDWYPDFRLFRQPRPGDWESVFQAVEGALAAL